MNKSFYGSLAISNIKKNAKGYVPYMLTCMFSIMVFYIMLAIVNNPDVTKLPGGAVLKTLLGFGCGVVGIFSAIFLFYTNSVLIKQRKKELGLYNILGMAKRHIGKVLLMEALFTSIISLISGLAAGVVLGKLFYLLLLKVLRITIPMEYTFSGSAALLTAIVFGIIFFVVLLCNLGRLSISNPVELLAGSRQGEKEPKTKWLLVIVGLITMGIGYYISITVTSPLRALASFFIAVLLVIAGTYLLFTAGSIALLKLLRKNKNFYYKTEHFTAVSGMLYRMKRNAAGLASICILSTMVLVTIATTVSMQVGVDDVVQKNFPNDLQIKSSYELTAKQRIKLERQVGSAIEKYHVKTTQKVGYEYLATSGIRKGSQLIPKDTVDLKEEIVQIYFIPMKGTKMEAEYGPLAKDEVIIGGDVEVESSHIKVGSMNLKVKDGKSDFVTAPQLGAMADAYSILVADGEVKEKLLENMDNKLVGQGYYIGVNIDEDSWDQLVKVSEALSKSLPDGIRVEDKETASSDFYSVYGGLLFVGIFLGLLFLMATVLIIYYKQISEGYEDSERYHIMQKVGMSTAEVKRSIRSQILIVFFLPLIVAVIHVAGAFNMMNKLLIALQLTNMWLFVGCTGITILIFAVIYVTVYSITAREYYKLVK